MGILWKSWMHQWLRCTAVIKKDETLKSTLMVSDVAKDFWFFNYIKYTFQTNRKLSFRNNLWLS